MKVLTMQLNSVSVMDIVAYGGAAIGMIVTVKEYHGRKCITRRRLRLFCLHLNFSFPLRLLVLSSTLP